MTSRQLFHHIRDLIARNELEQALQQLQQLLANSPKLDEALQQSGRFADIRKQIRLGVVSHAEAALTQNQIRHALLELLGEIEKQQIPDKTALGDLLTAVETESGRPEVQGELRVADSNVVKEPAPSPMGFFNPKRLLGLGGILAALIAILANMAEILGFLGLQPRPNSELTNVTVLVEDQNGDFVMRQQGKIVMMVEGGEVKQEDIDSKGAASFKNVKVGDKVRLKVNFSEPYHPLAPDSLYTIHADGRICLRVGLQNLDRVFGRVWYRDQAMPGVIVSVGNLRDTTDDLGRYEIRIPEAEQRQEQEVFFRAAGYKDIVKKAFPQTNQPLNVVMER